MKTVLPINRCLIYFVSILCLVLSTKTRKRSVLNVARFASIFSIIYLALDLFAFYIVFGLPMNTKNLWYIGMSGLSIIILIADTIISCVRAKKSDLIGNGLGWKTMCIVVLCMCLLLGVSTYGYYVADLETMKYVESGLIEKLDEINFDAVIRRSNKPILVDFYVDWCRPCKKLAPVLEEMVKEQDIVVFKLNAEENVAISSKYNVTQYPTLIMFKDGEIVARKVGFRNEQEIVDFVNGVE